MVPVLLSPLVIHQLCSEVKGKFVPSCTAEEVTADSDRDLVPLCMREVASEGG